MPRKAKAATPQPVDPYPYLKDQPVSISGEPINKTTKPAKRTAKKATKRTTKR